LLRSDLHLVEIDAARFAADAPESGIANGARLLEDFLEHEMLVAPLLGHHGIPLNVLHRPIDWPPLKIREPHALRRQHGHVAIQEKVNVSRVRQDGRDVRGDEVFAFSQPDHYRRAQPSGHDLIGITLGDGRQGEDTAQLPHGGPHGLLQAFCAMPVRSVRMRFDQVGNCFRIRFGDKAVAALDELFAEGQEVLDDPVVHDYDVAGAVAVRVGVLLAGRAVRGPARVTDTEGALQRAGSDGSLQVAEFSWRPPNNQSVGTAGHRYPGGVVAPIFQPPQTIQNGRRRISGADVSYNAAHGNPRWVMRGVSFIFTRSCEAASQLSNRQGNDVTWRRVDDGAHILVSGLSSGGDSNVDLPDAHQPRGQA